MTARPSPTPALPAGWIVFCAFCSCVGWSLSVLHALTATGYALAFLLGLAALGVWSWTHRGVALRWPQPARLRKRFGRFYPLGFLLLAALALLGGALYAPSNYDALAYRVPRVLNWLAAGHWHWIHTDFQRLNVRGCGTEWVMAPFIALTHSDRALFLISAISFVLLPGRVFSVLIRLGVRGRVAWYWMWLLPTGYCFLLQAGSLSNDLFGTTLALIAIEFALRARASQRWGEAAISVLAAALMTAAKSFNLLLLLPWAIAMVAPSGRLQPGAPCHGSARKAAFWLRWAWAKLWQESAVRPLFGRRWALGPLLLVAAGASLLPTAALNARYCGDWTGLKAEKPLLMTGDKTLHVAVNSALVLISNLAPPVFPVASAWNHCMDRAIPPSLAQRMQRQFESSAAHLSAEEMATEDGAGLGLGVSLLLLVWSAHRWRQGWATGRSPFQGFSLFRLEFLVPLGTLIALGVFMTQCGFAAFTRYLGPYYVILAAPLLAGMSAPALVPSVARKVGWRHWFWLGSAGVLALALLPLVLSPARPLWPAAMMLARLGGQHSPHPLVRRATTVYSVYRDRPEAFTPVFAVLPAQAEPLGLMTADDPEASLWRPFGHRRILYVCAGDTLADIRQRGIHYALVSAVVLENHHLTLEQWLAQVDAEVVQRLSLELRAKAGPKDWFLVRFR